MTEHKDLDPTISLTGDRGIHSTEGISAVADVSSISQVAPSGNKSGDRGRVVFQSGGANDGPGDYMLDGAGGFFHLGLPAVNVFTHAARHAAGGGDVLAHQALSGAGSNTHAQIDSFIAGNGATKQFFVQADTNNNFLNNRSRQMGTSATFRFNGWVPHDFISLTSLELIGQPSGTNASADIDLSSNYGKDAEALDNATQADTAATYNLVADRLKAIDIAPLYNSPGIEAGDFLGLKVEHMGLGLTIEYLGILGRYT